MKAEKEPAVEKWLHRITTYEREFKKWESQTDKILKRYRDEQRPTNNPQARFNVLWSNVQTLVPATYSRLPQPDVARRFQDSDPVGRIAALILERALDFELQHYPDFRSTMKCSVDDRFLGGRASAWVRYEPHFRNIQMPDGVSPSEDVDDAQEELDYECAPVDYVHWRDFGHQVARTWEEVGYVWRRLYLTRAQLVARFGAEGKKVPLDSKPKEIKDSSMGEAESSRGLIFEIWDKESNKAYWISKSLGKILDELDDPLQLEGFFPCPRPLFATLTSDTLVPVPDYTLYQDQANELDILCDRIDGLIKALQVKGVYNAEIKELSRLMTEGQNNTLIPVNNWMAFSEKAGLKGAIDLVDLTPIANALITAYQAMDQVKSQIYEITGVSDIVRGATDPRETLGAQQMKGQYATLRLKSYQMQVAQYATELLQLKAQVMCGKFAPETLLKMSGAEQFIEADKPYIMPALQLLLGDRVMNPDMDTPNPMRSFRIEVNADSLVQLDEQAEKEARVEFLTATGGFLDKAVQAAQMAPEMVPLLMEMLKFGVTGFKVGKTIEGAFDETAQKLKEAAQQPKPPNPEIAAEQARVQAEQQANQMKVQSEDQRLMAQMQADQAKHQADLQANAELEQIRLGADAQKVQMQAELEKYKADLTAQTQLTIEQMKREHANQQADREDARMAMQAANDTEKDARVNEVSEVVKALKSGLDDMAVKVTAITERKLEPIQIQRGPDGRAMAVGKRKVIYDDAGEIVGLH